MTVSIDGTLNNISGLGLNSQGVVGYEAGEVCFFVRDTAPLGFLKANGALVSRTVYSNLFQAIGTRFGVGDGSTTFRLPDFRGEFPRFWADDSATVDAGRALGSAQAGAIESHTHGLSGQTSYGGGNSGPVNTIGTNSANTVGSITVNSTGGAETRPRNVALLACIRY